MARMVMCAKLKRELPGLEKPPFPGELGQRIYDRISQQAWEMWQEQSRLVINHYGLNLADPDARQIMRQQMEEFLFGDESGGEDKPEGWTPEDGGGGGGAKGKGGAPEAPARKK
ncbi:MAG TPA: oxidative damage protection protein [Ktedonobacterales bacterium]|nr:oxidative damage protection protein [Ktedonobacterales bacterium]